MKLYSLFPLIIIAGCMPAGNHEKPVTTSDTTVHNAGPHAHINTCKPRDTFITATGAYVRYIANTDTALFLNNDTTYNVLIGKGNWSLQLGYGFDCSAPDVIVPKYKWSSEKIIALTRGCGNFCTMDFYYRVPSGSAIIRENVLATNERSILLLICMPIPCLLKTS